MTLLKAVLGFDRNASCCTALQRSSEWRQHHTRPASATSFTAIWKRKEFEQAAETT